MRKRVLLLLFGVIWGLGRVPAASAQQNSYTQTNLTANMAGVAAHTDGQLSNPWGISFIPGDVFWIANNNGGTSTTYDALGNKQSITAGIPVASMNPCSPGCPTGTVANQSTDFGGASFLFDTEDGILVSWNGTANAVIKVDNSTISAVYKGLALVSNAQGSFLLAANFRSRKIDVFDHNFQTAQLSGGPFTDPNLPAGYAPHGVHVINNVVFVTYAVQDSAMHDPVIGAGMGLVDLFQTDGTFVRRMATGGTLNAPWGVAAAPASFGAFSNDVLVGNFGDGTISAYDRQGNFLGQLKNSGGQVIANPGLWELVFGAGGTGDPNTLYFTAGGVSQTSGLFGLQPESVGAVGDGGGGQLDFAEYRRERLGRLQQPDKLVVLGVAGGGDVHVCSGNDHPGRDGGDVAAHDRGGLELPSADELCGDGVTDRYGLARTGLWGAKA